MTTTPSSAINLGKVRGTELLSSDTRERYREKIARITLDSMVQFVGLLDTHGTVLEINQVALDAVGIKLSDVEGKPFWTTFWWQVSKEINATLKDSIARAAQGEFVRWDTPIYGRAGGKETIIIDASLMPVMDEQGNVVFIAAEGRDITEKKAYEREIARQREELAQLDKLKTQFFANISHEFRTPLTLMTGPLEDALAQVEGLSALNRDRLEMAHRNSLRLLKLVNSLLDFSRIEAGRIEASYEQTDLCALTIELASVFRSAIERAGMRLVVDCQALSDVVYVDREMWEKVVLNLLSNAFKFTFDGEIEISLRQVGPVVQLTVRDTGTGIPSDEIPRLFERFHRVKGARGRSYEGSGIGLALVQELIKLHGGKVAVESEVDRGSTFTVTIPTGKAHLPADRIEAARTMTSTGLQKEAFLQEALRWLPHGPRAATTHPGETIADQDLDGLGHTQVGAQSAGRLAGYRILLADDNADMREYLRRLLSSCEVDTVEDGVAALHAARKRKPDLVLTDIMMPGMDGFELLRELRADPRTREVPVILLSARAGEESLIEGLEAGADDYLIKPFSAREVLARVQSHLELAKLRREAQEAIGKQNERLRLLWEAAGVLLTNDEPVAMLRGLFAKIRESLGLDVYFNFMVAPAGDALQLVSCAGIPEETRRAISRLEFGQAICGRVALSGEAIVASRIQESSEDMVQLVKGFGIRAYACNPLLAGGRLLGTLSFASRTRDHFEPEEIEFLETISQYVTVAYERLRMIEQLRVQDRSKNEFLATLAHELRNPLAPVRNAIQILHSKGLTVSELHWARAVIDRQIDQMARLVDDLMDVSRITRGKIELRKQLVEVRSIVNDAVEASTPLIESLGHTLSVEIPREPIFLEADPTRLAQVLLNLLNNAARYTEHGGHIWLTADHEGEHVVIRVKDTGVGIPADMLPRIFEMFRQVDSSIARSQDGLGIGLTLVQRLVAMHGGEVEARSEGPGKGSEFIVRLVVAESSHREAQQASAERLPIHAASPQRILVVDDNHDSADSMAMLLRIMGHEVRTAHDGLAAIDEAEAFQPSVILLDIGLPKLDGYEVSRLIRNRRGSDVVLIAMTGWGQEEDKRRSEKAGFDAHMVKPVDFAALEKLLGEVGEGNGRHQHAFDARAQG